MSRRSRRPARGGSRGFDLVRILGIQISVDPSWFVVFLLVLTVLGAMHFPEAFPEEPGAFRWLAALATTLLFFGSVLAHELSHSLVARALGLRVLGITLFVFGGVSRLASDPPDPWTEIKVAAAGPLMSFFLGATFFAVHLITGGASLLAPIAVDVLEYLGVVNLALGIFNLVPGFPLDGGRVMRAVVWLNTGSQVRGTRLAGRWGVGTAFVIMGLGGAQILLAGNLGGLWLVLIGLFLRGAALAATREANLRSLLDGVLVRDVMRRELETIPAGATVEAASGLFLSRGVGAFPVQEDGELRGVVTLRDLGGVPTAERGTRRIGEVMTPLDSMPKVDPGEPAHAALVLMSGSGHDALVVYEDRTPVGLFSREGVEAVLRARTVLGNRPPGS